MYRMIWVLLVTDEDSIDIPLFASHSGDKLEEAWGIWWEANKNNDHFTDQYYIEFVRWID